MAFPRHDISYQVSEAAYYARLDPRTVRSWLTPNAEGKSTKPQTPEVAFLEFIQLLAVKELRSQNIPLRRIKEAVAFAKSEYSMTYPFARKDHETYFEGKNIHLKFPDDQNTVQLSGMTRGQTTFKLFSELYMQKLEFDEQGLATRYEAHSWKEESIVIDPNRNYGLPFLDSVGIPAAVLYEAKDTEGGFEEAARSFDVSKDAVIAAVDYFEALGRKPSPETKLPVAA